MKFEVKDALAARLLAMGDDELLLGHRNSEWCGRAPILEEDIAFANLALDEIGHAVLWYTLLAELGREDTAGEDPGREDSAREDSARYADRMAYFRAAEDFRNMQMVELPKGDWAFSLLRQYLFDTMEKLLLERLAHSAYAPLRAAAGKARKEEVYHHRHSRAWIKRLGLGTEESNTRLQEALETLWPFTGQVFAARADDVHLEQEGYFPPAIELQDAWEDEVRTALRESGLAVPDVGRPCLSRSEHTPHLDTLIREMQSVARLDPEAQW